MIPSIDYLSLIVAGTVLYKVGLDTIADADEQPHRWWLRPLGYAVEWTGIWLFFMGTVRAVMGALGL